MGHEAGRRQRIVDFLSFASLRVSLGDMTDGMNACWSVTTLVGKLGDSALLMPVREAIGICTDAKQCSHVSEKLREPVKSSTEAAYIAAYMCRCSGRPSSAQVVRVPGHR